MRFSASPCLMSLALLCSYCGNATAQGTLSDYQRAAQFRPRNLRRLVSSGEIRPHWVGKTSRFWYADVGPQGTQFLLVEAAQNSVGPAFDQARLAAALSAAAR